MISAADIINDYLDATGHEGEFDETYALKCISDGADRIITDQQLSHMVAVLDVRDYKAKLPDHFKYVIQAASREEPKPCKLREEISQFTKNIPGTECELEINLVCPRCHKESCECEDINVVEVKADDIWKSAHPEYMAAYMKSFYSHGGNTGRGYRSIYNSEFMLMKSSSGSFWNAPYHINGCLNNRIECGHEYSIRPPVMVVNFKKGQVLLGYMARQTDENGYLMIPNIPQAIQAIVWYVRERMAFRQYSQTQSQKDERFWLNMTQMREKHIARAKSELRIPSQDEFWDFIQNHWRKAIPYRNWSRHTNKNMPDPYMFPEQTINIKGYPSQTIR